MSDAVLSISDLKKGQILWYAGQRCEDDRRPPFQVRVRSRHDFTCKVTPVGCETDWEFEARYSELFYTLPGAMRLCLATVANKASDEFSRQRKMMFELLDIQEARVEELKQIVRCCLADLEGVMPDIDPSGDRVHSGWRSIKEARYFLEKEGEKFGPVRKVTAVAKTKKVK